MAFAACIAVSEKGYTFWVKIASNSGKIFKCLNFSSEKKE